MLWGGGVGDGGVVVCTRRVGNRLALPLATVVRDRQHGGDCATQGVGGSLT